jgi:hypothetical protein
MKRRAFITLLGGAAVVWLFAARPRDCLSDVVTPYSLSPTAMDKA